MIDTQATRELISAAIDGEASAAEIDQVLNALADDAELRGYWTRLHTARQQLASPLMPMATSDTLERRFAAALAAEPAYAEAGTAVALPGAGPARGSWWQWGGAVAVAAAVAVTVVLGSASLSGPDSQAPATVAQDGTLPLLAPDVGNVAARGLTENGADASPVAAGTSSEIERETRALMLMHVQHAAVSSRASMVPVAKLAAFASNQR